MRIVIALAIVLAGLLGGGAPSATAQVPGNPVRSDDTNVTETSPGSFTGVKRWKVREGKQASTRVPRHKGKTTTATPKPHKLSKRELAAIEAMCREAPGGVCTDEPTAKTKTHTLRRVGTLTSLARSLIVKLQLPDPTPHIGPDPTTNEWNMAAVGYPLWLWTDGPQAVTSRTRAYGITFTLRATWQSTTFDMGDGHHITCTRTPAYPKTTTPGTKSPSCGYTYLTPSLPKGTYTVTATTNWTITWHALGQTGSIPGRHTGHWSLPVGELNALVVK